MNKEELKRLFDIIQKEKRVQEDYWRMAEASRDYDKAKEFIGDDWDANLIIGGFHSVTAEDVFKALGQDTNSDWCL